MIPFSNINFQKIKNARDFGGICNKDGLSIRPRCFIRSARLSKASEYDIELLKREYSLSTVIDLRTENECKEKPDVKISGVNYVHNPIFDDEAFGITREENSSYRSLLGSLPDLADMYRHMISDEYALSQFKREFEIIINHDGNSSILWHCSEGKDRCGVTSALFLSLLDVDRKTIFDDYMFTNRYAIKRASGFYFLVLLVGGGFKKANIVKHLFMADERYLQAVFDKIDSDWGNIDNFFRDALDISDKQRFEFKRRFLI